jgi:2-polyprenyl-3-methyl-5-hydroxy-6-metoxy-1,4-benzoquinol methylase
MYILYANDESELKALSTPFEQYMEPMLKSLSEFACRDENHKALPEIEEYLGVCRWSFRKLEYSFVLQVLLDHLHPGDRYLDAGCGVTPLVHVLANRQVVVDGCDYNERVIQELRKLDTHSIFGTQVRYSCEDLTSVSYADNTFDAISCVSVIEHIPAPYDQLALKELMRVLKPGGVLIVTVDFEPSKSATTPNRLMHYSHRVFDLVRAGKPLEIYRGWQRRLKASETVRNGLACQPRSANECFRVEHLQQDIHPLFQGLELTDQTQFSDILTAFGPSDAGRFWTLGAPGKEPQGRAVLPAAWIVQKPLAAFIS